MGIDINPAGACRTTRHIRTRSAVPGDPGHDSDIRPRRNDRVRGYGFHLADGLPFVPPRPLSHVTCTSPGPSQTHGASALRSDDLGTQSVLQGAFTDASAGQTPTAVGAPEATIRTNFAAAMVFGLAVRIAADFAPLVRPITDAVRVPSRKAGTIANVHGHNDPWNRPGHPSPTSPASRSLSVSCRKPCITPSTGRRSTTAPA